ncbi:nuclear transport factor 2 family protein [Ruegeria sp. AU67]|uniref:nuclear transport factor 2 family protein n=1 Tax=Ruegeria sp. AU67 TaxID=2108530 RepID=UPI000D6977D9|nr:nuclear transport factor 2 family protein [Ruegeria sp. AU67]
MDWQQTIADYGAAWQQADQGQRLDLLTKCFAEDGIYVDPTAEVNGRSNLCDHIGEVLQSSGGRVELTSNPNNHHDVVHFTWRMVGPDGTIMVTGHDFVRLNEQGKISHLAGFFGDPAPLS